MTRFNNDPPWIPAFAGMTEFLIFNDFYISHQL
jgi:hypothetical protein